MRWRLGSLGLVVVALGGCGTMRGVPTLREPPLAGSRAPAPPAPLGCADHPQIDRWETRLRARPSVERLLARGDAWVPRLEPILADEGLPAPLALLPAVESGFRPAARGRHDDVGLWQLRPAAARRFGLVVTRRRDDRLHPQRATRAAARYLRLLYARYRDWTLALAAYNAGEGRVDRALAAAPRADFWQLAADGHLPATCSEYVPRFLAVLRIAGAHEPCVTAMARTPLHD
ncbi:MAG: transglycosylase SLT domain-containing protein [bacterium]|nr:transglycosylase SLT domain-containing protein [bacterium]